MKDQGHWNLIIKPRIGLFELNLGNLWQYRDLIILFVKRDLAVVYKQTILGPLWFFVQPLFSSIMFTLVFGRIAGISTEGVPHFLFYLSGLVCWNYFAECLTATSNTFSANAQIFGKVYFPRLVIPISIVTSNLIKFAIQNLLLMGFYMYFVMAESSLLRPSAMIVLYPLLVLQMAILGLGFGILISSLTTKYRDLGMLLGFGMQLWMYATPIVYPLSQVPEKYHHYLTLNPMTSVITTFRAILFDMGVINFAALHVSWCTTFGILIIGILTFNRMEKSFMDTI